MNEAELLFSQIFNRDRLGLHLSANRALSKEESSLVASVLKRRIAGEPIQYILGRSEFMGLEFKVNPHVLIPRPETEILVEAVLKIVSQYHPASSQLHILDIGTGSGCIAVSLAKLLSGAIITATDISGEAIHIARENALLNSVLDRIAFIETNLFNSLSLRQYDIIVSNPPYVRRAEFVELQPEVRQEPAIALDAGMDGLDFYRKIVKEAAGYLKKNGFLIMEIGFNQAASVLDIVKSEPVFGIVEVIPDYSNIERVVVLQKKG